MRRSWIMLMAVAMAIAVALPAEAGKPVKPDPTLPTLFDVTFEFEGVSPGFSSTTGCLGSGATTITMEAGPGGRLIATGDENTDVPLLEVDFPDVEWYRYYPYYADADAAIAAILDDDFDPNLYPLDESNRFEGLGLAGCHGAGIDVSVGTDGAISVEDFPRFLMLTVRDGSVDFRWEADYYLVNQETASKNPRKPTVSLNAMEGFSYSDSNLAWEGVWDRNNQSDGLVTGTINVSHFSPGAYIPFDGSPVSVEFEMTITPKN